MRRSGGEPSLAWPGVKQQPVRAGLAEVFLGIGGELRPRRGRRRLLRGVVPGVFTIPFSKAGVCVLEIALC